MYRHYVRVLHDELILKLMIFPKYFVCLASAHCDIVILLAFSDQGGRGRGNFIYEVYT